MTNQELATSLRMLADFYEQASDQDLYKPDLNLLCWDKETLLKHIHAVGGTWTKEISPLDTEYALVKFHSSRIPGLKVIISRDKVCRKTVTWDCEPLLSPDEESEVEAACQS